jgi:isocitrate/isopropylmalate dehydrogenase
VAPAANIGDGGVAMFEAVHGTAPDIAGKGIANPTGLMLSAALLLDHIGQGAQADRVRRAVNETVKQGKWPQDLGGAATTRDVTRSIMSNLEVGYGSANEHG